MRPSIANSIRIGALAMATLTGSCTCSKDSEKPGPLGGHESYWAIHVYVGEDLSTAKRLDIVPSPEIHVGKKPNDPAKPKSLRAKATIETPAGEFVKDDPEGPNGVNALNSWALVWGAAVECGMRGSDRDMVATTRTALQTPVVPPWTNSEGWYIFQRAPASCDELLEYEQTLLCVADRLAQVSEDVAPITWEGPRWVPDESRFSDIPPGPWTLPPQSAKDRFIARDHAIDVLGHIARLDALPLASGVSCARGYAAVRNSTSDASANAAVLFGGGTAIYPPPGMLVSSEMQLSDLRAGIDGRFSVEAHILRTSGRMLRDLIRASVYADLSGAEQRSAHALDPSKGSAIAWGDADAENGPYNSLAHAARVIAGRWQLGPHTTRNRDCGGVAPLDLLKASDDPDPSKVGAADPDVAGRKKDLPITTEGQAKAVALIERAGLVIPATPLAATPTSTLRSVVVEQLVGSAALTAGVTTSAMPFQTTSTQTLVASVSDADLRYAFDRSLTTYQMLSNEGAGAGSTGLRPGIPVAPFVASGLGAISGLAVDKGIARDKIAGDTMARFGGVLAASQCNEYGGLFDAILADGPSGTVPTHKGLQTQRLVFQDAFSIGQSFHRRLMVVRTEAADAGTASNNDQIARGGLAEIGAWAGTMRVFASAPSSGPPTNFPPTGGDPSGTLTIYLTGIQPQQLGITNLDEVPDQLRLVWGPAWKAECAARLREDCGGEFESTSVKAPTSGSFVSVTDSATLKLIGAVDAAVGLEFDLSSGPTNFTPKYHSDAPPGHHLYLIAKHDPASKTGRGMVLGVVMLRRPEAVPEGEPSPASEISTSFAVAPMQRELLHAALGLGKWSGDRPPAVGEASLGKSPDYCIDGVARDAFVPLENELTSDGDGFESSWRHYLTLAKNAATRADNLGQQLIDIGLQRDFRREAAGEALAEICGDHSALDRVKFTPSGGVTASGSDATLETCLNEEKIDIVFLSDDPTPKTGTARTDFLQSLLRCSTTGATNPLCKRLATITTAGLGLAPASTPPPTSCASMLQVTDSLRVGLDQALFANVMLQPWTKAGSLASLTHALRLQVEPNGSWRLLFANSPIMSSTDTTLWPGCLRGSVSCDFANRAMVRAFNRVFRSCTPTQRETLSLGGCDAAPEGASEAAESTALLWRVEGALWMLSGLSGGVPAGLYDVQIPAADFNTSYWSVAGRTAAAAAATVPARFDFDSVGMVYHLPSTSDYESRRIIGDAFPLAGSALASISSNLRVKEMPEWIRDAFTVPTAYRLVHARNDGTTGEPTSGSGLQTIVSSMKGMACPDPYVNAYPVKGPIDGNPDAVATNIGAVKSNVWKHGPFVFNADLAATRACDKRPAFKYVCAPGEECLPPVLAWHPEFASGFPTGYPAASSGAAVLTWVNSNSPCAPCQAGQQLLAALSFACATTNGDALSPLTPNPPLLRNEADIGKLESWIAAIGGAAGQQLGRLYLEAVPKRIVTDFALKDVGSGSKKGTHGETVLAIRGAITGVEASWKTIGADMTQVQTAISSARLRIAGARLGAESEALQYALANLRVQSAMAQAVVGALNSYGSGNYAAMATAPASAVLSIDYGLREIATLEALKRVADEKAANDVALIVSELAAVTTPIWRDVDKALSSVRASTAELLALTSKLQRTEEKAKYEAAKGAGQDYVTIDGKVVSLPVNVVLRRQYDATSMRYHRALRDAKYYAHLARRAIEQRIGIPLSAIATRVGTLDPPAGWADDICRLAGVDYKRLRFSAGPDASPAVDLKLVTEFADSFVGDYVAKLENFVEFYNVDYPSHEGDDTAVLSLKDDLLPPATNCVVESPNLVYHSGRLDNIAPTDEPPAAEEHRWQRHACKPADLKCIDVLPAGALAVPIDGPPAANTSVTWLRDRSASSAPSGDAGSDGGDGGSEGGVSGPGSVSGGPPNMVSQVLKLEPGSYALSWWDQGRTATGELATATGDSYRVAVFDASWTALATWTGPAHVPSVGGDAGPDAGDVASLWSARRQIALTVTTASTYRVGFAPSLDGSPSGSVAIANVQLERVTSEGATAGAYVGTEGSRQIVKPLCATRSSKELRESFTRVCAAGGNCYYDLTVPLIVDTRNLGAFGSRLTGKLAAGNFNFRHIDLSLNLVGTGVRTCPPGSGAACYGSGYLDFSLEHDGRNSIVIDWAGNARYFDFAIANIEHGKALAAERYITLPIGPADQGLIAQPGILKPEFRGRPLEGSYRLRIWDNTALRWDRLDDIQLVLKYRYWSRISRSK